MLVGSGVFGWAAYDGINRKKGHVLVTVTFERTFSLDRSSPASTYRFSGGESGTRRVWGRWVADVARKILVAF